MIMKTIVMMLVVMIIGDRGDGHQLLSQRGRLQDVPSGAGPALARCLGASLRKLFLLPMLIHITHNYVILLIYALTIVILLLVCYMFNSLRTS